MIEKISNTTHYVGDKILNFAMEEKGASLVLKSQNFLA